MGLSEPTSSSLGWPDRFSQNRYSQRQREVASRASKGVVYTPQILLDAERRRQRKRRAQPVHRGRAIEVVREVVLARPDDLDRRFGRP